MKEDRSVLGRPAEASGPSGGRLVVRLRRRGIKAELLAESEQVNTTLSRYIEVLLVTLPPKIRRRLWDEHARNSPS